MVWGFPLYFVWAYIKTDMMCITLVSQFLFNLRTLNESGGPRINWSLYLCLSLVPRCRNAYDHDKCSDLEWFMFSLSNLIVPSTTPKLTKPSLKLFQIEGYNLNRGQLILLPSLITRYEQIFSYPYYVHF